MTLLVDHFMPVYDFHEVHSIVVEATPDRIFRAIKEVTAAEIPVFRALVALRALPARLVGRGGTWFGATQPLLQEAVSSGSVVLLAEIPHRELVLGTIGQFWKAFGSSCVPLASMQGFLTFDQPEYAKVTINFSVDGQQSERGRHVTTETRIHPLDAVARKRFAMYWRLISPGSALTRRTWLKAIKRRAEDD